MVSLQQRARSATRRRIYPIAVKAATQSYIHGVKEMYVSHSRTGRLFWTALFLLCLGAAVYEIYQVFRLWRDEGVATKISMETVPVMQYPTVLFCPTNWLNKTKVEELKVDQRALKYLLSILQPISNRVPGGYYWPSSEDKRLLRRALNATGSQSVAAFMLKVNDEEVGYKRCLVLLQASMDKKSIKCACCREQSIDQYVSKFGVCYVIDLCETPFQTHSLPTVIFAVEKRHSLWSEDPNWEHNGFVTLFENGRSIAFSTHDPIFLSHNVPVLIRLSLTLVKRISTRRKPCHDEPDRRTSVFRCELECYDKIENRHCRNCSMFSILETEPGYEPCGKEHATRKCSGAKADEAKKSFLKCKETCVPPCLERIFNTATASAVTMLAYAERSTNASAKDVLTAMFLFTSFTETVFEDVEIFNFDTFVSSLGGQAGLWCGASIISLFHLLSYCCCPCLHFAKQRRSLRNPHAGSKHRRGDDYSETSGEDDAEFESDSSEPGKDGKEKAKGHVNGV